MDPGQPLVSIVMASYNHAEYISEAIDSVFDQDLQDWEILIADDASTDRTLEVVSRYRDPRVRSFSFAVNRQVHMRNFALDHARGDYVAILNSDDLCLPGRLSQQVAWLESHPETAAVFSRVTPIDADGRELARHPMVDVFDVPNRGRHEWLRHFFQSGNCLCLPSVMLRRAAVDACGRFDARFVQLSDFDLWIRLCLRWELQILPEKLTAMRVLPDSANLSAPSEATANRDFLEHSRIARHYLSDEAIHQATEIFPVLKSQLPEPTDAWKRFLICQMACTMARRPMRLFGFQALQELLENRGAAAAIERHNPRMMRSFILSEGSSAMSSAAPATTWGICLPDGDGAYDQDRAHSFFRSFGRQTLNFSVPNPRVTGRIRIDASQAPVAFHLRGARLYEQQSASVIWELDSEADDPEIEVNAGASFENSGGGWLFRCAVDDPQLYLPSLDLDGVDGTWLDLELDIEPVGVAGEQGLEAM